MFELRIPVTESVSLTDELEVFPRYVYVDGKKTDEQETNDQGVPMWRVQGLAPVIEFAGNRVIDPDTTVITASKTEPDYSGLVELGAKVQVKGDFLVTKAQWAKVSGRLELEGIGDDAAPALSTSAPRHGDLED